MAYWKDERGTVELTVKSENTRHGARPSARSSSEYSISCRSRASTTNLPSPEDIPHWNNLQLDKIHQMFELPSM